MTENLATQVHLDYLEQTGQALRGIAQTLIDDSIRRVNGESHLLSPSAIEGLATAVSLMGDDLQLRAARMRAVGTSV